jgi:hypothetical protein
MKFNLWDVTIQQMIDESNHEPNESGKHRVLMDWRIKLGKEPHSLQPFQIDEIVREFRRRLMNVRQNSTSDSQARLTSATSAVSL